jgi:serine/threonine-protein kinase HipA
MTSTLEVCLHTAAGDTDAGSAAMHRIGLLHHDRGSVRFEYEPAWLADQRSFALDPDLSLGAGSFFPRRAQGNFGIFQDSAPDRWGRTLMQRREALQAKDEARPVRTLHDWDVLLAVQDLTRQGALRLRLLGSDEFLAADPLAAPPVTSLRELESVALELSGKTITDMTALRRWLAVLVAPGASLGGARPKANFQESDKTLWIGKFPAQDDTRDIGAWEFVAHTLASRAGVDVPKARMHALRGPHHTFAVQRFDRRGSDRLFYASAMTLLGKNESEGTSYLELAQFLRQRGDGPHVARDLQQLFRRVVFNVAVGNRDDHLRNHGFMLGRGGWQLAPAFDINPNIDKAEHVLAFDDSDNRPDFSTVAQTCEFYGLEPEAAAAIIEDVAQAVDSWRDVAQAQRLPQADIDLCEAAFSAHTALRLGTAPLQLAAPRRGRGRRVLRGRVRE